MQAAVSSVAGWYDIFLPGQLRDFEALQALGRPVRLTVGPWTHASSEVFKVSITETLSFGLAHGRDSPPPERAPVRLCVMGQEAWRDFPSWPPPGYEPKRYALAGSGMLAIDPATASGCDRYRYDPAEPTPAAGGVRMVVTGVGTNESTGRVDNRALEARTDVLVYTTAPLEQDLEVIGTVHAEYLVPLEPKIR